MLQRTNFTRFKNRLQVVFATLLNIYYVENHGIYIEGLFSWRMRYNREASKTYTSSHVHFGRGVHNDTLYFITLFAEDIFNEGLYKLKYNLDKWFLLEFHLKILKSEIYILQKGSFLGLFIFDWFELMYSCLILVLYLPDTVLNTLVQNATVAAFIQEEVRLVFYLLETRERPLCSHIKVHTVYISLMMHTIPPIPSTLIPFIQNEVGLIIFAVKQSKNWISRCKCNFTPKPPPLEMELIP